jgi:hypothetical protein
MSSLNIVIQEVSTDVVATVSGAIDLTGLSSSFTQLVADGINGGSAGSGGELKFSNSTLTRYDGMSSGIAQGPFGNNQLTAGDTLSINNEFAFLNLISANPLLLVDSAYVSNTSISGTLTFLNKDFTTMGLTVGTYSWSWNSGSNTLNLQVGPLATTPTPTPTPSGTPAVTPTPTQTQTGTAAVTPTPTGTAAVTPTPTGTAAVTPTPSGTPAVTPTPTQTQTGTAAVTPTPTGTAAVTPTPTPTSSPIYPLSGIGVDNQYAYTIEILGGFSGGTAPEGAIAPHPIFTDGDGVPYAQLNAITLGGFNGLNN